MTFKFLGFEISRPPKWTKERDLFFKCPKCGKFTKLQHSKDGTTLLTQLYGNIDIINRIELTCPCGGIITLCSQEYKKDAEGKIDWKEKLEKILKEKNDINKIGRNK